jgi:hypothetical protein
MISHGLVFVIFGFFTIGIFGHPSKTRYNVADLIGALLMVAGAAVIFYGAVMGVVKELA